MSLSANRAFPIIPKPKETEKKDCRYDEQIESLCEENGLYRKKVSKGPDSLMRAISEALHFTSNQNENIQQSLVKQLTQLIASNKLTSRLNSFQGNSMMLKDYANNPQLNGFEKTNLELVSLHFKVRVVLYTMNEENYLTAAIFNNNYSKTIELLRTKAGHYDAVFAKSYIKKAGICQNILLNIVDKVMNGTQAAQFKNINQDEYVNITYESSIASPPELKESSPVDQFRITRGNHKKSLSDNFNTNFEFMEEQQMKFYDAFLNVAPPDDFLKNFKIRKDTAESGFSINANFDFIDDHSMETPPGGQEFAIKNYPMPSGGLSPRAEDLELSSPMPMFSKAKFANHPNVLFNENLSLAEIERLEKTLNTATTIDPKQMAASPFYRSQSPPGLTPTRFSQKSFTEASQVDLFNQSPTAHLQGLSPIYPYGNSPSKRNMVPFMQQNHQGMSPFNGQSLSNQKQYPTQQNQMFAPQAQTLNPQSQTFSLQSQQFNNLYMKRTGNVGSSMSAMSQAGQSQEFNMAQQQNMGQQSMGYDQNLGFDSGMDYDQDMFDQSPGYSGQREKKKPIILDESTERYTGRLKFYDDNKKYGFIVMDDDGSDIFVHYDDLLKANINKDLLRTARMGNVIRLNFGCMAYIGKYNRSRKAIDIQLLMN
jgi:hypothetical protein